MGSRKRRHGVLILGGGPAGLATALSLVKGGVLVVLVERGDYGELRIGEHLPPQGLELLVNCGFSELGGDDTHVHCAGVSAWWGSDAPNHMDYLFHPLGHGVNLSRPDFDSTLAEQCRSAGVHLLTGGRLMSVARTSSGWDAEVAWQDEILKYRPGVIVDATGRSASFARLQGSCIEARDSQVALVTFRSSEPPIDHIGARVVIESTEQGWWYFAPLRAGRSVCMFMTDADLLATKAGAVLATWEEQLRTTLHVRTCIEPYPVLTRLVVRAARTQRLSRIAGPDWLAVGDAAISFDPLSSYGITKGFEHGLRAAETVLAHLDGDGTALQNLADRFAAEFADYEQTRLGYYSIERRWPNAPFWRRRQKGSEFNDPAASIGG